MVWALEYVLIIIIFHLVFLFSFQMVFFFYFNNFWSLGFVFPWRILIIFVCFFLFIFLRWGLGWFSIRFMLTRLVFTGVLFTLLNLNIFIFTTFIPTFIIGLCLVAGRFCFVTFLFLHQWLLSSSVTVSIKERVDVDDVLQEAPLGFRINLWISSDLVLSFSGHYCVCISFSCY